MKLTLLDLCFWFFSQFILLPYTWEYIYLHAHAFIIRHSWIITFNKHAKMQRQNGVIFSYMNFSFSYIMLGWLMNSQEMHSIGVNDPCISYFIWLDLSDLRNRILLIFIYYYFHNQRLNDHQNGKLWSRPRVLNDSIYVTNYAQVLILATHWSH